MTQLSKRGRNIRTNNSLRSYEREDQSVAIFMDRSFTTDKSEKEYSYCLKFSNHAITRSDQRAIDLDTISIILDYGITFQKQGLEFCTCLQREIPRSVDPQLRKKLANIILVINPVSAEIVTCYHCKNPVKYLSKKTCKLKRYNT